MNNNETVQLGLYSDVGYESYKAHRRGPSPLEAANFSEPTRIGLAAVQRAAFQSIASMFVSLSLYIQPLMHISLSRALPAFTIHTVVAQARKAFVNTPNPRIRSWGPTITGLAFVPILPYIFDRPVEHVTDQVFDWIKRKLVDEKSKPKE